MPYDKDLPEQDKKRLFQLAVLVVIVSSVLIFLGMLMHTINENDRIKTEGDQVKYEKCLIRQSEENKVRPS